MVSILQQSLYHRRHPKITNEDPAREFSAKLEMVENLWHRKAAPWPWPGQRELGQFRELRKVKADPLSGGSERERLTTGQEWDAEEESEESEK
jgi:hypothetical protein